MNWQGWLILGLIFLVFGGLITISVISGDFPKSLNTIAIINLLF